jgi:glycosyltransferase involved in cell wall biosynthesis
MNIIILSPYSKNGGGLSEYTKRNAAYLKQDDSISVHIIPFNSIFDIFNVAFLSKKRPDVVRVEFNIPAYGIATIPLFFILFFYKKLTTIKFIANYHEVKRETEMLGRLGRLFYKIFSKQFHKIYVHTNEAKIILCTRCGVPKNNVIVEQHGPYYAKKGGVDKKQVMKRHKLQSGKKLILQLGYIHPDKGIEDLIEAINLLASNNSEELEKIQVLIAGGIRKRSGLFKLFEHKDKKYDLLLTRMIHGHGLQNTITRTGHVANDEIHALLNYASIFVLPYKKVEQSGILNLYIPYKKPIIATNIGGLKETLKGFGYLIPANNAWELSKAISLLIQNKSQYNTISRRLSKLHNLLKPNRISKKHFQL